MEFLVRLEQDIPPDIDPDLIASVKAAEKVRATELAEAGIMRRLWRLPGRRAVMALYEVDGPDELHEAISSLPLFPWMDVTVTALSHHALDPRQETTT